MKTIIAACSLVLASSSVLAGGGIYGSFTSSKAFGNPDLGGIQYPVTLSEPMISRSAPRTVSLDDFYRGNPDGSGVIEGYTPFYAPSGPTITSLEVFMGGNPDLGYAVDWSQPVVGSPEATAIAARNCAQRSRGYC